MSQSMSVSTTPLETETNRGEEKDDNSPESARGISLKEVNFPSQSSEPSSSLDDIANHDNNTDNNIEGIEEGALERANAHEKNGMY